MPEDYEDIDPRVKTPELEKVFKQRKIQKLLAQANYSIMDVITGKGLVEILNQIDPDNEYQLGTIDSYFNED